MKRVKSLHLRFLIASCVVSLIGTVWGISPKTTLTPPVTGEVAVEGGPVAVDGNLTVVGSRSTSIKGRNSGVVKIYDTASGNLIRMLTNPKPGSNNFGACVAVSGMRIAVSNGADLVYIFDLSSADPQVPLHLIRKPSDRQYLAFGSPIALSGRHLAVGSVFPYLGTDEKNSVSVYDLEGPAPMVPVMTIYGPPPQHPAAPEYFGYSIAISGDRLALGAPRHNNNKGAAFVYNLAPASPVPVAELYPPADSPAVAFFGWAVDIDGGKVAVGQPADAGGPLGKVFLHDLAGADPSIATRVITDPLSFANAKFGRMLALSGNFLAVTADHTVADPSYSGRVEVYDLSVPDGGPLTLKPAVPQSRSFYGESLDLSGSRLVLSGYGRIEGYDLASNNPGDLAQIYRHALPGTRDRAGEVVAVSGSRVAVAGQNESYPSESQLTVYDLASATPHIPLFSLLESGGTSSVHWGISMEGNRMAVSILGRKIVRVYDLASSTPSVPVLEIAEPTDFVFGNTLSLSGGKLAVGAPSWNGPELNYCGRVYLYDLDGSDPTAPIRVLENPEPSSNGSFGLRVALSGSKLLVGASMGSTGLYSQGVAYLFDLSSGEPLAPIHVFRPETPVKFGYFAASLALEGDTAVLSDEKDGHVLVYDVSGPGVVALHTFSPFDPDDSFGEFGGSTLALSGGRLAVSDREPDYSNTGTARVYDLSEADPEATVKQLDSATPGAMREFGFAIAIDGDLVVVGAPGDDGITYENGAADVFDLSAGPNPPFELWAAQASLIGEDAEEDATPKGDGIVNLLKYAFNLPADGGHRFLTPGSGTSGLPASGLMTKDGCRIFRMEYLRRKNSNLTYTPVISSSPGDAGASSPVEPALFFDIDAQWERVIVEHPVDPSLQPSLFGWVEVHSP